MEILLVEDDEYKSSDISKVLSDIFASSPVKRATSVSSALRTITEHQFDVVILDMSLPTFDLSGPGGGGSPQGQGGLDVLRLASYLKCASVFVVLTQYPDIGVDGREFPLPAASKVLRTKFSLNVSACLLYDFDSDAWKVPFRDLLVKIAQTT